MVIMNGLPASAVGGASRLVILLDVDGVLNPRVIQDPSAMENHHRLVITPTRAQVVRDLASLGTIVWATTWDRTSLQQLSADLGVDIRGSVPMTRLDSGRPTPKLPAVQRWITRMEATGDLAWDFLVWIDDDLGPDAQEWVEERRNSTLLIRTDSHLGVQRAHAKIIRQWLSLSTPQ